jgi:hypothetical protein
MTSREFVHHVRARVEAAFVRGWASRQDTNLMRNGSMKWQPPWLHGEAKNSQTIIP